METQKQLIKRKMKEYGDSYKTLADAMQIPPQMLFLKVCGKVEFIAGEITLMLKRYRLTERELDIIIYNT